MDLFAQRAPWYVAGPLMGMLIVGLRAIVNKPLGALGGYIDIVDNVRQPSRLGFRSFLLLGFVVGGAMFAILTDHFHLTLSYGRLDRSFAGTPGLEFTALAASGVVMGIGARRAGGCTSGHGMCGMSLGSPASFVAAATFFGTAVGVTHLLSLLGLS